MYVSRKEIRTDGSIRSDERMVIPPTSNVALHLSVHDKWLLHTDDGDTIVWEPVR